MTTTGYGNREDRIGDDPPCCDKAWHMDKGGPVPAVKVLKCACCGKRFARCSECQHGITSCEISMRAHLRSCYRGSAEKRRRVLPGRDGK